jgi:phage terminase large subunit GpA-like protein
MSLETSALALFAPPPKLNLSKWIEENIRLPDGLSASPGPMELWPWQRDIADAISDPTIERISLLKASRIGFTALTVGAIGAYVVNDPTSVLVLLPTESDCRDFIVSDVEPTFASSPALRRARAADREEGVPRHPYVEKVRWRRAKGRGGAVAEEPTKTHRSDIDC